MNPTDFVTVATFNNGTSGEMRLYLEMIGDEVVLSPGHEVDLLARPSEGLLPISVVYVEDGLQVFANREPDPDWHIRFKGRIFSVGSSTATKLADMERSAANDPGTGSI